MWMCRYHPIAAQCPCVRRRGHIRLVLHGAGEHQCSGLHHRPHLKSVAECPVWPVWGLGPVAVGVALYSAGGEPAARDRRCGLPPSPSPCRVLPRACSGWVSVAAGSEGVASWHGRMPCAGGCPGCHRQKSGVPGPKWGRGVGVGGALEAGGGGGAGVQGEVSLAPNERPPLRTRTAPPRTDPDTPHRCASWM